LRSKLRVGSGINQGDREQLIDLLLEKHLAFAVEDGEMGCCNAFEAPIETTGTPVALPLRRRPIHLRDDVEKEIQKLIRMGIVEESTSEWASPIVAMRKRGSTEVRITQDYREVNKQVRLPSYPIPMMVDLIDRMAERHPRYMSKLDMVKGYFQLAIREEDRPKTAFRTHGGCYQYTRLPMGISSSPGIFQRCMNKILGHLLENGVYVYLDDIGIVSETIGEHLKSVGATCDVFVETNMKLKPEKCEFLLLEMTYLGQVISQKGISADPRAVQAVWDMPVPINQKEVRRFCGLASYLRRFIKDFSRKSKALTALTKKDQKFEWSAEAQEAFEVLKEAITTAPVLQVVQKGKAFFVEVDGSAKGLGAVLMQEGPDGKMHPVAYASRALNSYEANYPISELEALAIVYGLNKFRAYLFNAPDVRVITDHSALTFMMKQANPSGRVHRWAADISAYSPKFYYKKGKHHNIPDSLSRMYRENDDTLPDLGEMELADSIDDFCKREEQTESSSSNVGVENSCNVVQTRAQKRKQEQQQSAPSTTVGSGLDRPS
ncbi:MAG: hypothetical protein GY748_10885, partial [Planctomycetaceae bacterium]|nr:hypothetical protein [Planctomycetaceae bacterium]